jgi:hypothetical protein
VGFRGNEHSLHHDRFADALATARDAEAEPDAEGREEDGDERAVELDGVLDDNKAVFGVLKRGDEEAADETENENVALHDVVVKKYIPRLPSTRLTRQDSSNKYRIKTAYSDPNFMTASISSPESRRTTVG